MKAWSTCNLTHLSLQTLKDPFNAQFTTNLRSLKTCLNHPPTARRRSGGRIRLPASFDNFQGAKKCLDRPIQICKASPAIVLKFIRLKMKRVLDLLPMFPNMKVIHLVRDPRGMFNSRDKITSKTHLISENKVKKYCKKVHENMSVSKFIHKQSPNQFKFLVYEDLAETPFKTARAILTFAGLKMTSKLVTFLKRMTSSSRDSCQFCTQRKNSSLTASKWRKEIKMTDAIHIYNACAETMDILGYLNVTSKRQLSDMSFDTRTRHSIVDKLVKDNRF